MGKKSNYYRSCLFKKKNDGMKKLAQKLFRLSLSCAALTTMISSVYFLNASADTEYTSGDYTYTLSNNKATITKYSGSAGSLTVPSTIGGYTVEAIGKGAFKDNTSLTSLSIANGIATIGEGAFEGCTYLTTVTIPSSIIAIGVDTSYTYDSSSDLSYDGVFQGDERLESVTINAGSEQAYIGNRSFYGCISLKEISIPGNYEHIYGYAFQGCTEMTSVNWAKTTEAKPNQVMCVSAFYGDSNITSVTLNSVTTIGNGAFYGNTKLTDLQLNEGLTEIGEGAFEKCTYLTTVTIPSTVTAIGVDTSYTYDSSSDLSYDGVFQGDERLESVTINAGSEQAYIGNRAFYGCISLKEISIPGNYEHIYGYAFQGCTEMTSVTWAKTTVVKPNQVMCVNAFYGDSNITSVTLNSVTTIGNGAFYGNTKLTDLQLNEGLTEIGEGAFEKCAYLKTVTIPSTVTAIGVDTSYTYDSSSDLSYDGVFQGDERLESVTINAGSEQAYIGNRTFYGCVALKEISIPGNYEHIYGYAFQGCTAMTSVTWAKTTEVKPNQEICVYAFYGDSNITSVSLNSVKTIGNGAFYGNTKLTDLQLNEGLTSMGEGAFEKCTYLKTVTIPSTVTAIGVKTSYTYDSSSDVSYDGVFQGDERLESVTLKAGTDLAYIGNRSFYGCIALKEISIPGNYECIYGYAFQGCTAMSSVTWAKTTEVKPNQEICVSAFYGDSNITSVSLNSVKTIGNGAFYGNTKLTDLQLNEGLTSMGEGAFEKCTYLKTATIPSTVTAIGVDTSYTYDSSSDVSYDGVFQGDTALTTVLVKSGQGDDDYYVGNRTFADCTSLKKVYFYGKAPTFYDNTFRSVVADAYYPSSDTTWTSDVKQNYGGTITWNGWTPSDDVDPGSADKTKDISSATVTLSETSFYYDGSEKKPAVTVTLEGSTLTLDTDYTVSYKNNTEAGTATVTVSGTGKYTGTVTAEFTILSDPVDPASITIDEESYFYVDDREETSFEGTLIFDDSSRELTKEDVTTVLSNIKWTSDNTGSVEYSKYYWDESSFNKSMKTIPFKVVVKAIEKGNADLTLSYKNLIQTVENKIQDTINIHVVELPQDTHENDAVVNEEFKEFYFNGGTSNVVKYLTLDKNYPSYSFMLDNDSNFGSALTTVATDTIYRGFDGWKDLFTGETSVKTAKNTLAALLDSYSSDCEELAKAQTAKKISSLLVDGLNAYILRSGIKKLLNTEQLWIIQNEFDEKNVEKYICNQNYDKILTYLMEKCDISADSKVGLLLQDFNKSQEMCNALSKGMSTFSKGLKIISASQDLVNTVYQIDSLMRADEMYIDMLEYLKDNCRYSVVAEAAGEFYNIFTGQISSINSVYWWAYDQLGEAAIETAAAAVMEKLPPLVIISTGYNLGTTTANLLFNTANDQELKDLMRIEAYTGSCLASWMISNQTDYVSKAYSGDDESAVKAAKKLYYSMYMCWKVRKLQEGTLQEFLKKQLFGTSSAYYAASSGVSSCLDSYEENIFTETAIQKLLGYKIECPVDVDISDADGNKLLTVYDGDESSGVKGDIYYYVKYNPISKDYNKFLFWPEDKDYTVTLKGTGTGTVTTTVSTLNENGNVISRTSYDTAVKAGTRIVTADVSIDQLSYSVTNAPGEKEDYTDNMETSTSQKIIDHSTVVPGKLEDAVSVINNIGNVTLDSESAIKEARDTYDGLSDDLKAYFPDSILKKLTDAEESYSSQKQAAQAAANANQNNAAGVIKVSSIGITAISNKIAAGKKVQLTANVLPETANDKTVTWQSSNTKVATVSQSGVVTIKKKTGGKTVMIIATAADGSGVKAIYKIKSMKGVVKKLTLSGSKSVKAGKKAKIKAKISATKGANKSLKWTSSNTAYATVTNKGIVTTTYAGKGQKVTITAMATDGSGVKKSFTIKIK